jgi:hypothetical protein
MPKAAAGAAHAQSDNLCGVTDPAITLRYIRAAALAMAATALLAVGALIAHLAGSGVIVVVLVALAASSAVTGVCLASVARRRAFARRDELRRQ